MRKPRWPAVLVGLLVFLAGGIPAMASSTPASGVTWKGPDYSNTSGVAWYAPTYIQDWGGYRYSSQLGAWGRHIYASTDWTYYDQSRRDSLRSYYQGTNYQYVPTTIHFNEAAAGGAFHSGLHATGWWYANTLTPEFHAEDDNGDTRQEEANVRWSPYFSPGGYNVEVEYWDPLYNADTGVGGTGEVNVSAYITTATGWYPIGRTWMCKFIYPALSYQTWTFDCPDR